MRLATREDGPALCRLFRDIPMEGDLQVRFERDPDFFALYDLQRTPHRTVVLEADGAIEGLGSVLVRDAYLQGERTRVAYLADLRLTRRIRGGAFLGHHFPREYKRLQEELGFRHAYTVILDANRAARWALVKRHRDYPDQPRYVPWRKFSILNVQLTRPRRVRSGGLEVRRATAADLHDIAQLLAADHRQRPFGYVLNRDVLQQRLRDWPGLSLENFYIARRGPQLLGTCAAWDPVAVKTFRVLGYRNQMVWARRAFNTLALLTGSKRLPPAGGELRFFYLSHVSVLGEDPAVMAALVDRIYSDTRRAGYHFLTTCVYEDDPLAPAYRRYASTAVPATLYYVASPEDPPPPLSPQLRPGFEMALV